MSSSYRLPRAVHTGFDEHGEHEVIELHHGGLDDVLTSVQRTAADLLAQSPHAPTSLTVRAGVVAVEMTWDTTNVPAPAAAPAPQTTSAAPAAASGVGGGGDAVLAASTVGVFYRSPSPGAAAFVKEGDQVVPGQQVAIIEAMKLMLPVEADKPGRVVEVLVKDGASVEFGQPLFRLAPIDS
jgi:acetyl-CoA carboxylase biotin carboxyl carrier protein